MQRMVRLRPGRQASAHVYPDGKLSGRRDPAATGNAILHSPAPGANTESDAKTNATANTKAQPAPITDARPKPSTY